MSAVSPRWLNAQVCLRLQVRDWYVESFRELREFPRIQDINDEAKFTDLLRHIYHRSVAVSSGVLSGYSETSGTLLQLSAQPATAGLQCCQ